MYSFSLLRLQFLGDAAFFALLVAVLFAFWLLENPSFGRSREVELADRVKLERVLSIRSDYEAENEKEHLLKAAVIA